MKKFLIILVAIIIALGIILVKVSNISATNLLQNGNFSNPLGDTWTCSGDIDTKNGTQLPGSGTCSLDTTQFFSGLYSAHVINTSTRDNWGWQISQGGLTTPPDQVFCLSAKFKKSKATDIVSVNLQEDSGQWLQWPNNSLPNVLPPAIYSDNTDTNLNWQTQRRTITIPSNWGSATIKTVNVYARVKSGDASNWHTEAWFDDISLQKKTLPNRFFGYNY